MIFDFCFHSFDKYLFSVFSVPHIILGIGNVVINNINNNLCLWKNNIDIKRRDK
jgi:hypothetical protein